MADYDAGGFGAPAGRAQTVTKSDSTVLSPPSRGLYIGGAGDLYVDTVGGDLNVPYIGVAAGSIIPVRAVKVRSSTTATNIVSMS